MSAKKRKQGGADGSSSDKRHIVIGKIILQAREKIIDPSSEDHLTQAQFYARCRELEDPPRGVRKGVAFPSEHKDGQRSFMIGVEKGRIALSAKRKRFIEQVCGWPAGVLDGDFSTEAEFEEHRAALERARLATTGVSDGTVTEPMPGAPDFRDGGEETPHPRRGRAKRARTGQDNAYKESNLSGLRTLPAHYKALPSRAALAKAIQSGLTGSRREPLRIVAVQGEAGVGKSQLIAEWWHDHGGKRFKNNSFTLDCARLGGDKILQELNAFFLSKPTSELTVALADSINALDNVLIVLDGLSDEEGDTALVAGQDHDKPLSLRHSSNVLAASGRADRIALRRVREILIFLGRNGARASILLGIQTAAKTTDSLRIAASLSAEATVTLLSAKRLSPREGATMMTALGVSQLSDTDLRHLSSKLEGLPISLAAVAHYLRTARPRDAENFLIEIDSRGKNFGFFEEFFGRYLDALSNGPFDERAHPHAYLRLLALMPGKVEKSRVDDIMSQCKILRLQDGSTEIFSGMRIDFVVDYEAHIDLNPMIRGLLRQEINRLAGAGDDRTISKEELRRIHACAAQWCLDRFPKDSANFSKVDIEIIEGALYHLLELRDYLQDEPEGQPHPEWGNDTSALFEGRISAKSITQRCLGIVRRFLLDPTHRLTRFLGQFETKARLLSLFFESLDVEGRPKHLSPFEEATVYSEMGVCWMHAGRLQLAKDALDQANVCMDELGARTICADPRQGATEHGKDLFRLWTNTVSTRALIMMRLGRDRETVEYSLSAAVDIAESLARDTLSSGATIDDPLRAALLRSARRVLCRKANVAFYAGDLRVAETTYALAADLERLVDNRKLTGDAVRRQIEVLVRRGPCFEEDLALAMSLVESQFPPKQPAGARRRLSNDLIPLITTKIMLLRAKGEFREAQKLLNETLEHELILRGECTYTARMELELERYRLMIAMNTINSTAQRGLRLIAQELEARHHRMMYWDTMLLIAESEDEPERTAILDEVERQSGAVQWLRRRTDIDVIRHQGNAVQALVC